MGSIHKALQLRSQRMIDVFWRSVIVHLFVLGAELTVFSMKYHFFSWNNVRQIYDCSNLDILADSYLIFLNLLFYIRV